MGERYMSVTSPLYIVEFEIKILFKLIAYSGAERDRLKSQLVSAFKALFLAAGE